MTSTRPHLLAVFGLLLLPVVLLWPCLIGDRTFVPWDIAQFPPASTLMTDAEYQDVIRNNNTDVTEIPAMFVPELRFIKSEIARGQIPHWNPYARSGTGVWSSSILGFWYPINWLMLVADDPQDALAFGGFLSIAIASILMYGFLIHLGLSVPGAIFGAIAFGMSGTLTVNLHFYQRINALIWLPGILWSIGTICQRFGRERLPAMLGLACCLFMTHTAGFPPFALAATLIGVAFTVRCLFLRWRENPQGIWYLTCAIGAGALLGVTMAAVQSIPMFEFFPQSNRSMQASGNVLASGGYDPAGLLGYLCPTIYTHPHINYTGVNASGVPGVWDQFSPLFWFLYSRESWLPQGNIPEGSVFQPNLNFCEYTVFVGTPTLFLAVAGLLHRCNPLRWFAAVGILLLFMLASASGFISGLLESVPFRWIPPTRYTGPTCLFIALLAGVGVHALPDLRLWLRRSLWIVALGLSALCFGLWWWVDGYTPQTMLEAMTPGLQEKYAARFSHVPYEQLPSRIQDFMGPNAAGAHRQISSNLLAAAIALLVTAGLFLIMSILKRFRNGMTTAQLLAIVLTTVELLRFGIPLNTGRVLHQRPLNQTAVHGFLRTQREKYRDTGGFSVLRAHDPVKRSEVPIPSQLPPDTLLNEHIRDQQAYTFVDKWSHRPILQLYGPQQLARDTWALSIRDDERLSHPYWDMIGVRFVLSEDELKHAGSRVGPILAGPPDSETKTKFFYVYERPHPLPRAWVVHDFREVVTKSGDPIQDTAEALIDPSFEPSRYVLLDRETIDALGPDPRRQASAEKRREVRFPLSDETNSLTLQVAAGDPGYLVVNDTFMQGWHATINGQPATTHRGNLFQRVLVLPGDAATVEFRYTTPGFPLGLALSLASLFMCLGLVLYLVLSRRPTRTVEDPL